MKNKLLLIIGCAVIALSAIFLILYLVNSGLFAKPYNLSNKEVWGRGYSSASEETMF